MDDRHSTAVADPDPLLEELERELEQPEQFGRYLVLEQVGEGSMGRVYRALDPATGRDVAVKALRPSAAMAAAFGDCRKRFQREVQAAGGLAHPNIVVVYDVDVDFYVMEFLHGVTLRALLDARGRLPLEEALGILSGVADALDHAHRRGIVHRDVKPGNIMILPDGRPKVMDFGVAHLESSTVTAAGECLGSPLYMAPEQIEGERVTGQADVFGLAAVAYEMITGHKAFAAPSLPAVVRRVLHDDPTPASALVPRLPAHVDAVLARGLRKSTTGRFSTASAMVAALRGLEAPAPVRRRPPVSPRARLAEVETQDLRLLAPAIRRPSRWRRWLLWSPLVLLGMFVAPVVPSALPEPPAAQASLAPVPEPPRPARLTVHSDPAGAIVWLDGEPVGRTPLETHAAPGTHTVKLARKGFAAAELQLTLSADERTPLTFRLQPVVTTLAPPPVARVAISPARESREPEVAPPSPDFVPPRRVAGRGPNYPWEVYPRRLQGLVRLELTVTETGEPKEITVLESPGEPLSRAMIDAVQTWRFEPARRHGKPVSVRWQVQQRFSIRES